MQLNQSVRICYEEFSLFFALCLSACQHPPLAYITNQGANTVSVIDTHQQKVTHTITVGKAPVGLAVSKKLQRVL